MQTRLSERFPKTATLVEYPSSQSIKLMGFRHTEHSLNFDNITYNINFSKCATHFGTGRFDTMEKGFLHFWGAIS